MANLSAPAPLSLHAFLFAGVCAASASPALAQSDFNVWFANDVDTTQIFYNDEPRFLVIVDAGAGDALSADTLAVSLSTEQGDRETYQAVETGPATGRYVAAPSLKGIRSAPTPDNHVLEVNGSDPETETVIVEARVEADEGPVTASMDLGLPTADAIVARSVPPRAGPGRQAGQHSIDGRWLPRGTRNGARGVTVLHPY